MRSTPPPAVPWALARLAAIGLALLAACHSLPRAPEPKLSGFADLHDGQGNPVGDVLLDQHADYLAVDLDTWGLAAGRYQLQLRSAANCQPFAAAGSVVAVSPGDAPASPALPVEIGPSGGGKAHFETSTVQLSGPSKVFDWNGSAFTLAAAEAPELPLACGVVKR